jgi:hypothetical protein
MTSDYLNHPIGHQQDCHQSSTGDI